MTLERTWLIAITGYLGATQVTYTTPLMGWIVLTHTTVIWVCMAVCIYRIARS